jgi:outer membrane protein OmpA-like peptidoglycan-associated protein
VNHIYIGILIVAIATGVVHAQVGATVLLQGVVLDAQTRRPITAQLIFRDANGAKVNETRSNAAEGGAYQCILKPNARYTVELQSDGYMKRRDTVTLPAVRAYTELSRDFTLLPKTVGHRFVVGIPLFELNSASFRVGASDELAGYAELLSDNQDVHITIECYPDRGDEPQAMSALAQQRAEAIRQFFVQRGIASSRLSIQPISSTDPYNPPPRKLRPKGRFYFGGTYFVVARIQ